MPRLPPSWCGKWPKIPDRPAPRQTRAEVEELLRNTRLDEQMKSAGQWEDWKAGRRGVSQ